MSSTRTDAGSADLKAQVQAFWDAASCGEVYAAGTTPQEYYESHRRARYALEPYIATFARFDEGAGRDVLEVGVGMGADHVEWARSRPRRLAGIDLTPRAVAHTRTRLAVYGLTSELGVGDAERLPFADASFDIVYSYGVLHHSPDTPRAVREVHRVLRAGGTARIMIYHARALTGYMLWLRYALLAGRPGRSLADVYFHHLESAGTKAYTREEARRMCADFSHVQLRVQLNPGDLLEGATGQRHGGVLLRLARALWPRPLLRRLMHNHGLALLIEAVK